MTVRILFMVIMAALAYYNYKNAKRTGTWAWSRFWMLIAAITVFCCGFMMPLFNSKLMENNPDLGFKIYFGALILFMGAIYYLFQKYPAKSMPKAQSEGASSVAEQHGGPSDLRDRSLLMMLAVLGAGAILGQAQVQAAPLQDANAKQLAALQRACSSGALTPEECTQRKAQIKAQGNAQGSAATKSQADPVQDGGQTAPGGARTAAGAFHDPKGRYSLTVPQGWSTEEQAQSGVLQLSSGPSWAMLMTGGGSVARDVDHDLTQQIQSQFTGFQLLNEGDLTVHGHSAHGSTATGINPKGERVSVLVLSIDAGGGHFLSVISSAPNDQAKSVNATVMQIAQSIRFAGE